MGITLALTAAGLPTRNQFMERNVPLRYATGIVSREHARGHFAKVADENRNVALARSAVPEPRDELAHSGLSPFATCQSPVALVVARLDESCFDAIPVDLKDATIAYARLLHEGVGNAPYDGMAVFLDEDSLELDVDCFSTHRRLEVFVSPLGHQISRVDDDAVERSPLGKKLFDLRRWCDWLVGKGVPD